MRILSRGPNVYYSFLDLTERQQATASNDFFKALLPITSDTGLLNVVQDINDTAVLKNEYGSYRGEFIDYALHTAKDITDVSSSVLVSRMSSGKEGYKVIDFYLDENNEVISTTIPTFKNATPTSNYSKGEDVFSEGIVDYKVYKYDKSDKPNLSTINGITVPTGTVGAIVQKYLMSIQTFKPVNFEEFTIKVGAINNEDKLTISENSYLTNEIIDNKFIKIYVYNKDNIIVEEWVGAIEEGHLDINDKEYYLEEVVNLNSVYIYINGLTTETYDISTKVTESISETDTVYFTNNTTIDYDMIVTKDSNIGNSRVFNSSYNNKKILFVDDVENKYLKTGEFVYTNYAGDISTDGVIANDGTLTPYNNNIVDTNGEDYFIIKEKCNDLTIFRKNSVNLDSVDSSSGASIKIAEDGTISLSTLATTTANVKNTSTELTFNYEDIIYSGSLIDKVDYKKNTNSAVLASTSLLSTAVTDSASTSGTVTINTITKQITFNDVEFTDVFGTETIENAYLENEELDGSIILATQKATSENFTKFVVNGTASYSVSGTDKVVDLINTNDKVLSTLSVELTTSDDVAVIGAGDFTPISSATTTLGIISDLEGHYGFNLRNTNDIELLSNVVSYDAEGLDEIYQAGGAKNLTESKELNFFFLLDAIPKNLNTWEIYQASLNSTIANRKDCIGVLYSKNFTLQQVNEINKRFEEDGSIDVNNYIRFQDYGNEFATMEGGWYDDVLDSGQKIAVPAIGYKVGRWLLGIYSDKNIITAGVDEDTGLNFFNKDLKVSVDEEVWDVFDKMKVNIPVKVKGYGNYNWFKNTTYSKQSDLRELNNMITLVYLIRSYYPILIKYIHKRYIDRLTGTNYVIKMKNEMLGVLNEPTVSRAFAKDPVLKPISTEEELESGIIVWKHQVWFGKTIKAIEVQFVFEKSGSFYLDILQDV